MSQVLLVNPARRRRASKKSRSRKAKARSNPSNPIKRKRRGRSFGAVGHHKRRYRRNPTGGSFAQRTAMPAAIGAAGAIGVDLALALLPVPDTFKTGMMRPIARIAAGIGIGMVVAQFMNRDAGAKAALGAITVIVYDTAKTFLQQNVPALPLSDANDYPAIEYVDQYGNGMNALLTDGSMGALVEDSMGELVDEASFGELVDEGTY